MGHQNVSEVPGRLPAGPLLDDHSLLVWQTCAYAEDLSEAARSGQRLTPAFDQLLGFLQYRLLPYLRLEERQLAPVEERLGHLLLADHDRLRARVAALESSSTRRLLVAACDALVEGLDQHVRREERWLADRGRPEARAVSPG